LGHQEKVKDNMLAKFLKENTYGSEFKNLNPVEIKDLKKCYSEAQVQILLDMAIAKAGLHREGVHTITSLADKYELNEAFNLTYITANLEDTVNAFDDVISQIIQLKDFNKINMVVTTCYLEKAKHFISLCINFDHKAKVIKLKLIDSIPAVLDLKDRYETSSYKLYEALEGLGITGYTVERSIAVGLLQVGDTECGAVAKRNILAELNNKLVIRQLTEAEVKDFRLSDSQDLEQLKKWSEEGIMPTELQAIYNLCTPDDLEEPNENNAGNIKIFGSETILNLFLENTKALQEHLKLKDEQIDTMYENISSRGEKAVLMADLNKALDGQDPIAIEARIEFLSKFANGSIGDLNEFLAKKAKEIQAARLEKFINDHQAEIPEPEIKLALLHTLYESGNAQDLSFNPNSLSNDQTQTLVMVLGQSEEIDIESLNSIFA
jgi:hypothetical protein